MVITTFKAQPKKNIFEKIVRMLCNYWLNIYAFETIKRQKKFEKVGEKVKKGLEWYKELKCRGNTWDPLNRINYELYPNMKNEIGRGAYIQDCIFCWQLLWVRFM